MSRPQSNFLMLGYVCLVFAKVFGAKTCPHFNLHKRIWLQLVFSFPRPSAKTGILVSLICHWPKQRHICIFASYHASHWSKIVGTKATAFFVLRIPRFPSPLLGFVYTPCHFERLFLLSCLYQSGKTPLCVQKSYQYKEKKSAAFTIQPLLADSSPLLSHTSKLRRSQTRAKEERENEQQGVVAICSHSRSRPLPLIHI